MLSYSRKIELVERIGDAARNAFEKWGVPASVLISQAISEGLRNDWSLTPAAEEYNNWFGIAPRIKEHYGAYDFLNPSFATQALNGNLRRFRSLPECMHAHAELLTTFYPSAMGCVCKPRLRDADVDAFVLTLARENYSKSDPELYSDEILCRIDAWKLRSFDKKTQEKKAS